MTGNVTNSLISSFLLLAPLVAQVDHQHHPPASAEEYAKVLNDPKRNAWQKPHEVITALNLKSDETVADIGAGTGYFALRFARHAGTVYAVDIDEKLLAMTAKNAPPNLKTVLAAPDDPKLPPQSIDTIFFCDVLHHISNRPDYYAKLLKALKPGGRVVMIDFHKRPLPVGPGVDMKLSSEQVDAEMAASGLRKVASFDFLEYQYFNVYTR